MGSSWAACWRTHGWWPPVWWQEKDSILNTHRGSYTQSSPRSMATASCKRMNATFCRYVLLLLYIIFIYILDILHLFLKDFIFITHCAVILCPGATLFGRI